MLDPDPDDEELAVKEVTIIEEVLDDFQEFEESAVKKTPRPRRGKAKRSKEFVCFVCQRGYTTISDRDKHLLMKHNINVPKRLTKVGIDLTCDLCSRVFLKKSHIELHMRALHMAEKDYVCEHCGKSYAVESSLQLHIQGTHGSERIDCHLCERSFALKSTWRTHYRTFHKQEPPNTKPRKKFKHSFRKSTTIGSDHDEITPKIYQCEFCSGTYSNPGNLKVHVDSVHLQKKHQCQVCFAEVSSQGVLRQHMKSLHLGFTINCPICDQVFKRRRPMLWHIKTIHEGFRFECGLCDKTYAGKHDLKSHIEKVHRNEK